MVFYDLEDAGSLEAPQGLRCLVLVSQLGRA